MTQIGEAISIGLVPEGHDEATCPFCQAADPKRVENVGGERGDEHELARLPEVVWQEFHNDARTLGRRLAKARGEKRPTRTVRVGGSDREVWSAAHHLIPGKEALQVSDLYNNTDLLWKDGEVEGGIGYDVNRAENGVWLPGSYAIDGWGEEGAGFIAMCGADPQAPTTYAWKAIAAFRAQFHDRHKAYSDIVFDGLNRINSKLELLRRTDCPEAADATAGRRALPQIIRRLDRMSARLRALLTDPDPAVWKTDVYTSRFSLWFMERPGSGFTAAGSAAPIPEKEI